MPMNSHQAMTMEQKSLETLEEKKATSHHQAMPMAQDSAVMANTAPDSRQLA